MRATVRAIRYRVDVNTLEQRASDTIAMNEIAEVEFETNLPLFFDSYRDCRWTGSLILIDALTNATVGAAMISGALENVARGICRIRDCVADPSLAGTIRAAASATCCSPALALASRARATHAAAATARSVIDDPLIADSARPSVVRALDSPAVDLPSSSRTAAAGHARGD